MSPFAQIPAFGFDRRTVYVVGASRTGQSIARFLLRGGDRVLLSDLDLNQALDSRTTRLGGALSFSRGHHDFSFASRADLVVLSSGIPFDAEIARFARLRGKRVLTAVEFVASESSAELIVVTGTSGKTTTLDVLRKLVGPQSGSNAVFLTDRSSGASIASALESPECRHVIAELSVAELSNAERLGPSLLVVTSLIEENNHDDYEDFDAYLGAKFGWLASIKERLPVVTGSEERISILRHFEKRGLTDLPLDFEIVPDGVGPTLVLAERVRRVMAQIGLESSVTSRKILDAIRSTLLERCESIEGFAMPILNIGECKNPDSLAWTAGAICTEPRIITARSLGEASSGADSEVIDLNQNPIALEEAIEMWATRAPAGSKGTVVIDEFTRKRLFSDQVERFETAPSPLRFEGARHEHSE